MSVLRRFVISTMGSLHEASAEERDEQARVVLEEPDDVVALDPEDAARGDDPRRRLQRLAVADRVDLADERAGPEGVGAAHGPLEEDAPFVDDERGGRRIAGRP